MVAVHKVNVLGPMMVTQALLPLLRKGSKKVVQPLDSPMPVTIPFLHHAPPVSAWARS